MSNLTLHSGKNGTSNIAKGVDVVSFVVPWNYKNEKGKLNPLCPLKDWDTWNSAFFDYVKSECKKAQSQGKSFELITRSTSTLRMPELKLDSFYFENGGPVHPNSRGSGVGDFFTKNESIIKFKRFLSFVHERLPEKIFPNLIVNACWEIFSGWKSGGKQWASEMIVEWKGEYEPQGKNFRPRAWLNGNFDNRPIGIGTPYLKHIDELKKETNHKDIILFMEAWNFKTWRRKNWYPRKSKIKKYEITWNGFWPWQGLYYENPKYSKSRQRWFDMGEKENAAITIKQIALMLDYHINASYPFQQIAEGKPGAWFKRYNICVSDYNFNEYRGYLEKYLTSAPVVAFKKNQSKENRGKLERYTKKYIRKLRS